LQEARPPGADPKPCDVRGSRRHGDHLRRVDRASGLVRLVHHRLAVLDPHLRQLRGGDGRRPRQSPSQHAAQDALGDRSAQAAARRYRAVVAAATLAKGDLVVCEAGDLIPSDGEITEGIASVDESAITGESAPVIRESGGDRSAVTGGTRVLSDWLVVRATVNPGEAFIDRMIAMVEGAKRQKTP